jgi:hypothetical protein
MIEGLTSVVFCVQQENASEAFIICFLSNAKFIDWLIDWLTNWPLHAAPLCEYQEPVQEACKKWKADDWRTDLCCIVCSVVEYTGSLVFSFQLLIDWLIWLIDDWLVELSSDWITSAFKTRLCAARAWTRSLYPVFFQMNDWLTDWWLICWLIDWPMPLCAAPVCEQQALSSFF